jgi:hypothetical protein
VDLITTLQVRIPDLQWPFLDYVMIEGTPVTVQKQGVQKINI